MAAAIGAALVTLGVAALLTNIFQRRVNRHVSTVAFIRRRNVNRRFRNWNPRFRPADKFRRIVRRLRENQRHRIRQADIFRRANHNSPRDEARVFSGMNHFRKPIERRIRIAAPHGFDESRDRVVMSVAIAIIDDRFLLNTLFCH